MSSLRDRLELHAVLHDEHVPHDAEQVCWAADLRKASSEIARLSARVAELGAAHEDASGAILQAVEAERERCAKACEAQLSGGPGNGNWNVAVKCCAAAVRALPGKWS
jgi:hypothetical protein